VPIHFSAIVGVEYDRASALQVPAWSPVVAEVSEVGRGFHL
jgi:hypothetical protein